MHIFIDIKKDNSKGWGCLYRGNLFFFMKNSYIGTFIYINQIKKNTRQRHHCTCIVN